MSWSRALPLVLLAVLAGCGGRGGGTVSRATLEPQVGSRTTSAPAQAPRRAGGRDARRSRSASRPSGGWPTRTSTLASAELPVARAQVLRRVLGASEKRAAALAQTSPQTSAITRAAPSAAQSCLGDTLAQTILGSRRMGRDAALGVGLAQSGDAPGTISAAAMSRDALLWNDPQRGLYLRLEPYVGGRWIEVHDAETESGFEVGRVTAWEPGTRLGLTWTQVGWPDGLSTEIEVMFAAARDGTRVRIEQTGFERLGSDAVQTSAGYEAGWNEVLGWFAEHAREESP